MDPLSLLEDKIGSLVLDDYEIYTVESRLFSAGAKEGQIEFSEEARERGVAVRLFKGNRCGFGCSSDWSSAFLEKMLDLAYKSLALVEAGPAFELPSSGPGEKSHSQGGIRSSGSWAERKDMALHLESEARGYDPRIRRVREARYSEEQKTVRLKNSRGLSREGTASLHELSLMVVAEENAAQEMAWESDFSPDFSGLNPARVAGSAAEKAVSQLGARPVPTQKTGAVLDPVVAASFLGVLSSSFLGDQAQKNRSALKNRLGEKVYSPQVLLKDNGRLPGGFASFPFDGEGRMTEESVLVEQGTLKRFLYDSRSASQEGASNGRKVKSTGNAVRPGFKEAPRVGATNFFIESGSGSLDDLLADLGRGFWIRDVIGVHTADPISGDFSLGASGIWIEGGQRRRAVRGVTLSGNLHKLFEGVVRAGAGTRFFHSFGSPPLLIGEIDLGGT